MITKDQVLERRGNFEMVHIKSLRDDAVIRVLSGTERLRLITEKVEGRIDATLAFVLFMGTEDGSRMFGDDELEKLESLDGLVMEDVFLEGIRVNRMSASAEEEEAGN